MKKTYFAAMTAAAMTAFSAPAFAGNTLGTAFGGYDPVTYSQGAPEHGKAKFFHLWDGALWTFSSEENRDTFKADPAAYAPQFDAYCAWAASQGYKRPGDPNVTEMVDGKLYTFVHEGARDKWRADVAKHIADGEANWVRIEPF
ncbi:YHS domain protein [Phaeobacter italicus]|jgi:YHS domain-containing protein|uniref:YHS domain protein n=1 Tax=Phaeobacter italicus TaxID=481446 RepID=A0A0H5D371_9RHOB|nr:YHS domain-containing (seleno)protein [Phaeobacter italicus]CRL11662.1 YHS domain protein [Phaeobacter italicus]